jgi:aspartyl-tRNA(Asn)/glutamyl-tRNA(Gln) amidotransferase subunit A
MAGGNLTVKELFALYNDGSLSREELEEKCPELSAKTDTKYHAFLSRTKEVNPAGVPAYPCVAADNICAEGPATTCGSAMLGGYRSPFTATALEKAFAAGFCLLGKTNLDEFGIGDCTGRSFLKTSLNPGALGHLAGSGAAAVVAAGGAVAGFGSDARGGLRQSASFCGLVGLKPTYGRVSRYGLIDYASSLDQIGVMAGSVEEIALALRAISGFDSKDPTSRQTPPDPDFSPAGARIAVLNGWDQVQGLTEGVKTVFNKTVARLPHVEEVPFPYLPLVTVTAAIIGAAEAFSNLANFDGVRFGQRAEGGHLQDMYVKTRTAYLGERVKEFLTFGAFVSSGKNHRDCFLWARKNRGAIYRSLMSLLSEYDFILLPTVPFPAPALYYSGNGVDNAADVYTAPANLAGLPAVTVPAGLAGELPVGVQLTGRPFAEAALLKMAEVLAEQGGVKP